jgi:hypothetical protein
LNFFPHFPIFILFLISILAETNRHPFDLPEAEAELVSGYNVEYSSMTFALFFLGEYSNILFMSALTICLFFGGFFNIFLDNIFFFAIKIALVFFFFVWVRVTLPRYRYDQLMLIGWKNIIPFTFGWFIFIIFYVYLLDNFIDYKSFQYINSTLFSKKEIIENISFISNTNPYDYKSNNVILSANSNYKIQNLFEFFFERFKIWQNNKNKIQSYFESSDFRKNLQLEVTNIYNNDYYLRINLENYDDLLDDLELVNIKNEEKILKEMVKNYNKTIKYIIKYDIDFIKDYYNFYQYFDPEISSTELLQYLENLININNNIINANLDNDDYSFVIIYDLIYQDIIVYIWETLQEDFYIILDGDSIVLNLIETINKHKNDYIIDEIYNNSKSKTVYDYDSYSFYNNYLKIREEYRNCIILLKEMLMPITNIINEINDNKIIEMIKIIEKHKNDYIITDNLINENINNILINENINNILINENINNNLINENINNILINENNDNYDYRIIEMIEILEKHKDNVNSII